MGNKKVSEVNVFQIFVILLIVCFGSFVLYDINKNNSYNDISSEDEVLTDALKFKDEYESLNGKVRESTGAINKDVSIDSQNPIVYADFEQIKSILTNGTGVIYFGFPECPWCRTAIPILIESSNETGLDKIYYFNAYDIRDEKKLNDNGEIVTEKEGTSEYNELISLLGDYASPYDGLNDESVKRLYFPTVVFVKDGKIIKFHEGTVDGQKSGQDNLTDEQKSELKSIYSDGILKVLGEACDKDSKC